VATRQVGDETLSPRAYDLVRSAYQVITRQGGHRLSLQDVADEAIAALVDAVFVGPEENRQFYLLYLDLIEQRPGSRPSSPSRAWPTRSSTACTRR
jgi:hypothetical protein